MALERLIVKPDQRYVPLSEFGETATEEFEAWLAENLRDLPENVASAMDELVPRNALFQHFKFNEQFRQNFGLPSFHNHNHIFGALAVGLGYILNSSESHDPLQFGEGIRELEEKWNTDLSECIIPAFCIAMGYHDACEIATGYVNSTSGPEFVFRKDGYRARRSLTGYPVPENLSAEIALAHIANDRNLDKYGIGLGLLVEHIINETTWEPSGNPLQYAIRSFDRLSGVRNPDHEKDWGNVCELSINKSARVCVHTEFNFHTVKGPEVLPPGVSLHDVFEIIGDSKEYYETVSLDGYPEGKIVYALEARQHLYRQAIFSLDPDAVREQRITA